MNKIMTLINNARTSFCNSKAYAALRRNQNNAFPALLLAVCFCTLVLSCCAAHEAQPTKEVAPVATNKVSMAWGWLKAKSGSLSSRSCTKEEADKKNAEARAKYEKTMQVCREAIQASQSNK